MSAFEKQWMQSDELERDELIRSKGYDSKDKIVSNPKILKTMSSSNWLQLVFWGADETSDTIELLILCYKQEKNLKLLSDLLLQYNATYRNSILDTIFLTFQSNEEWLVHWAIDLYGYDGSKKYLFMFKALNSQLTQDQTRSDRAKKIMKYILDIWLEKEWKGSEYDLMSYMNSVELIETLASLNFESQTLYKLTKRIEFAPKAVRNIFLKK